MILRDRGASYFEMKDGVEFVTATTTLAVLIAFKLVNATRCPFNMDEPQHLHVIWGWAHGFVQYRDICDNHMPLFQIIFAPIFRFIGDRATILYWMRFILMPIYFTAMWCTYRIGTLLFSRRTGIWAVILAGFYPTYHFVSLEFRTDNLWAMFWLLCILVLLNGAMTVRRSLAAGLLLGFAFGVSMKTALLFLSILVGASLTLLLVGREKSPLSWPHILRCVAAFVMGMVLVPGVIMIAFAAGGVWQDFRYWVFDHNILPRFRDRPAWLMIIFPVVFPLLICVARLIVRQAPDPSVAYRRCFVFLICGFYITALLSFWSLVVGQHFLPYHPLAFVFYSAALLSLSNYFSKQRFAIAKALSRIPLPACVAAIEFLVALGIHPFWIDGGKPETDLLRAVLKLTGPGDYVFDTKGQTIFRQRCFRPIIETFTTERIRRGLMIDNVAQRCIDTRTCVAVPPEAAWLTATQFIERNYLPVGNGLRVAGVYLKASSEDANRCDFEITVPAFYKIVAANAPVTGRLDGIAYDGARFLAAGAHTFEAASAPSELAVLWAQAVDRNFTPFR